MIWRKSELINFRNRNTKNWSFVLERNRKKLKSFFHHNQYSERKCQMSTRVEVFGYIFVRNAVNAVNFCKKRGDCGDCGEKNNSPHFTAFLTNTQREIHRISYKNSPHMISKVYSIWFKFTWNLKDVIDSWPSGLSSWRHAGGHRFKSMWGKFFL